MNDAAADMSASTAVCITVPGVEGRLAVVHCGEFSKWRRCLYLYEFVSLSELKFNINSVNTKISVHCRFADRITLNNVGTGGWRQRVQKKGSQFGG